MSDEHITSGPQTGPEGIKVDAPSSGKTGTAERPEGGKPAVPPLTWSLFLTNLAVQIGVALFIGVVALLVLSLLGSEGASARGGGLIAALLGLWAARSFVHWPIPRATLKAHGQLPPNIHRSDTGGRDVVETIVFVVVLVLLLKLFAAEAFVIPTGSMAETLYGYQKMVTCPTCGDQFPVNAADEVDPQDKRKQAPVTGCKCRNCEQVIRLVDLKREGRAPREGILHDPNTNFNYVEITDPGWSSGDRVLVGKFFYDTPLSGLDRPRRLDVVVFKFPGNSQEKHNGIIPDGPQKNHTAINFIKRLIGLPGETIAIYGGDLYVLDKEKSPTYHETAPLKDRWQKEFMHENDEEAKKLFAQGSFSIIQKPPRILLAMMRLVYDNDHQARDLKGMEWQRWEPRGEGWETLDDSRAFQHSGDKDGPNGSWLEYRHLLRDKGGKKTLITDFMGYNTYELGEWTGTQWVIRAQPAISDGNWVGDLILECEVKVEKNEGKFVLELVKSGERFRASWDLSSDDGRCTLTRQQGDKKEVTLESQPTKLRKGTYRVRFANVDQRLTVWVDDSLPFDDGVTYKPGETMGPTELDLKPTRIGLKGAAATVRKIKLFRDTYYTQPPSTVDVGIENLGDSRTWKNLSYPVRTLYVQPGHYLCMGDNSPSSSDGRSWGLVPQRLLLGRALMVYYPFWPFGQPRAGRIR
jgi:signal peptidase I